MREAISGNQSVERLSSVSVLISAHQWQSEAIREAIRLVLTCGALQLGVHRRQVGAREEPGARLRAIVDDAIERAVPDEGGNQMRIRGKSEAINGHQRTHRPSEMR